MNYQLNLRKIMKDEVKKIKFFDKPIKIGIGIIDENAILWHIGTDNNNTKYVCYTNNTKKDFPKQSEDGHYPTLAEFIKFDPYWKLIK